MAVAKQGVWVDTKAEKVTTTEPVEGHLLVAVGCEVTPDMQTALDAAVAAYGYDEGSEPETAVEPPVETAAEPVAETTEPAPVETTSTRKTTRKPR